MAEKEIFIDRIEQMKLTVIMADIYPDARNILGLDDDKISEITGIEQTKIIDIADRKYIPSWSEFMALIFLFTSNDKSRSFVLDKGLFPEGLRKAMSINRNEHD